MQTTVIPQAAAIGASIYASAGVPLASALPGGCEEIADLTGIIVHEQPKGRWADVFTLRGQRRGVIRAGLDDEAYNWATGWAVAALYVERQPWAAGLSWLERDALCREVATWLAAPTAVLAEAYCAVDLDIRQIAAEFVLPEAACALGVAELPGGPSCVVVTHEKGKRPGRVWRRGSLLRGFSDAAVRELARNRRPKNVRRVVLSDGIALFALPD